MLHIPFRAMLALLLLLTLAACQSTDGGRAAVPPPAPDSPVVVEVGTTKITAADFQRRLNLTLGGDIQNLLAQGNTAEQIEQMARENNVRRNLFDRMLQEELLLLYARRNGIGVDPTTLDAAVFAQLPAPDVAAPLASQTPLRVDTARNQLVVQVIVRNTRADMYRARQILVPDQSTATVVLDSLKKGTSFAELAAKFSQDPASAEQGGELGWLPAGNLPPELDTVGLSGALGTPTIVQSQTGLYVFEVLERQAGTSPEQKRPFDSIEQLQGSPNVQQFYQETFVPWYETLYADAIASGELQLSPGFDPESVPLPLP